MPKLERETYERKGRSETLEKNYEAQFYSTGRNYAFGR